MAFKLQCRLSLRSLLSLLLSLASRRLFEDLWYLRSEDLDRDRVWLLRFDFFLLWLLFDFLRRLEDRLSTEDERFL